MKFAVIPAARLAALVAAVNVSAAANASNPAWQAPLFAKAGTTLQEATNLPTWERVAPCFPMPGAAGTTYRVKNPFLPAANGHAPESPPLGRENGGHDRD